MSQFFVRSELAASAATRTPTQRAPVWAVTLAAVLALNLAACDSAPKLEGSISSAERLYREAREDMEAGAYDRAIKSLERVEGLAAGSLLAQQAQLDLAYAQWRGAEKPTALATIERFIKLNPSSPGLDYAMYLRGMINFNENLGLLGDITGQKLSERDQRASRDAWQAFKQLSDQFPNSRYTPDAKLRLCGRCQPGAASGGRVLTSASGRRGALFDDGQLRQARAQAPA
jgi:outer membrane protein assembly factor BamD